MKYGLLWLIGGALVTPFFGATGAEILGNDAFRVTIASAAECTTPERNERPRYDILGSATGLRVDGVELLTGDGLADEFGIIGPTPGYDAADRLFLKYGIGILKRTLFTRDDYFFYHPYPVKRFFPVQTERDGNLVTFRQQTPLFHGIACEYQKQFSVNPAKRTLEISYRLTNTGTVRLETDQYNHNFFRIPPELDGKQFSVTTDFTPVPHKMTGDSFDYCDRRFTNLRCTPQGCYTVSRAPVKAAQNRFTIAHPKLGYSIEISGDFPSTYFAVSYRDNEYISPEIFITIRLEPGESLSWKRVYRITSNANVFPAGKKLVF